MLCESTIRGGSLSPGGAWRRLQSPRNENSRLTTSKPPGAQDPVQGPLHRWHRDLQPLEAVRRGETKRILRRSGLIEPIWAARHAAYVGGAAPGGYRVHSSESWLSSSEGQFL